MANSSGIAVVRVRQAQVAEAQRRVEGLEVEVVRRLRRPAPDWETGNHPEPLQPLPLTLAWKGEEVKQLRSYDDFYWSVDLSSPGSSLSGHLKQWQDQATEVLLFSGFQSPHSGPLDFLVNPTDGRLFLADLTPVTPDDALQQISVLLDRYRGVQALRLVLIDASHFRTAYQQSGVGNDQPLPEARTLIIPADNQFERLLLAQMNDPQLLHEQNFTVAQVNWLKYTRQIYPFASQANAAHMETLLRDPDIGPKQQQLLQDILKLWSSEQ